MFNSGDDIGAIVADIGSHKCRIGYAGEDSPRANFQTSVGILKREGEDGPRTIVHYPETFQENMEIDNPIRDGMVTDFELYEDTWNRALSHSFRGMDTKDHPLLLSEKVYNSPKQRQKICEIMMEKFNVPGLFMSRDACLACYAVGRTTGVVVDVGASGTVISPVSDGWVESKALNRCVIGGRAMDQHLLNQLAARGTKLVPLYQLNKTTNIPLAGARHQDIEVTTTPRQVQNVTPSFEAFARLELARDLKENVVRTAESSMATDARLAQLPGTAYELPDGTQLDVGIDRFSCTELLCDPTPFNQQSQYFTTINTYPSGAPFSAPATKIDSVPNLVYNSILRSDPEMHANLFANLIITGGGVAPEGTPERLKVEMEKLVPGVRIKAMSTNPDERSIGAWLGGSILASLGSFHELWVSRQDYEEFGPSIVDRKCP